MIKQPEITAATKRAFIDAFCILYKEKPIEKITVQEITRKAGYNRCTFYQYFRDAYDLLSQLEDETISYIVEAVDANLGRLNISDAFIMSFAKLSRETEAYVDVLLGNQNSTKFAQRAKTAMTPVLMAHFKISEDDDNAIYVLEFYLSGAISIANRWILNDRKTPAEELGKLIHTLLTDGVLRALGRNWRR